LRIATCRKDEATPINLGGSSHSALVDMAKKTPRETYRSQANILLIS
jgi:hypothetical protein